MKLSNIFKKEAKQTIQPKVQTLDKKQLEKVIGGADTKTPTKPSTLGGSGGGAAAASYA